MVNSSRMILKNARIMTLNDKDEMLENMDILIEGDTIRDIRNCIDVRSGDKVIDCRDRLVTPGFVNSHLHSDENLFKGWYPNLPLELWMLYAYPLFGFERPSNRLIYLRTMLGAIEMVKSGATTIQDDFMEQPFTTMDGHSAAIQAYVDLGLRTNVSVYEMHHHFCDNMPYLREIVPSDVQKLFDDPEPEDRVYARVEEMIQEWNGKDDVKIVVSISAPQRCDDKFSKHMFDIAEKYDVPYHIHICETRTQRITGREFYGSTIPQHSAKIGILSPRTTIAHCNWIDDEDIEVYKKAGVNIVHNPVSNLKLGSGIMPFNKLYDAGINICLGTDGMSTNDSNSILEVMKTAALLHKVTQPDFHKWPSSDVIMDMVTRNAARSVRRTDEIGAVEVGKKADLLVFDLNTYALAPETDYKSLIIYCENGRSIDKVIARGKLIMDNHELITVNEKAIMSEVRELWREYRPSFERAMEQMRGVFPYLEEMYWKCMNDEDPLWRFSASKDEYKDWQMR